MSATMFIYRGLPGSGKTTDAKVKRMAFGGVLAGRDHLRHMIFGAYVLTNEQENTITNVQRNLIRESLRAGQNVYVDDMNLRNRYVRDLVEIAVAEGAQWAIRDFTNVPLDRCLKRNALRDRKVPEHVIRNLHGRFIAGKKYPLPFEWVRKSDDLSGFRYYAPDESLPLAVMCDIDGTLAHMSDRDPYDGSRADEDSLNFPVGLTIRLLNDRGVKVLFCSGRSETHRTVTRDWIAEKLSWDAQMVDKSLFMRAEGDRRRDSIVKLELFDRHIRHNYNVLYVLDDRQQVVDAWRSIGLTVFQVAEGDF